MTAFLYIKAGGIEMRKFFWGKTALMFIVTVAANIPLLWQMIQVEMIFKSAAAILTAAAFIYINIFPYPKEKYAGKRLRIMIGGRVLVLGSICGTVLQTIITICFWEQLSGLGIFYGMGINFLLMCNGLLRIFFTSKWLSVRKRLLLIFTIWIPLINLLVILYVVRLIRFEYDFECYKASIRETRAESDMCSTKYPLILVHGVGFRDFRHFNYWGRIPRELKMYGAQIYYGNQEAFGTIEYNAEDIKRKIFEVLEETGAEKVNIIAHSKGGLDSRYAISMLGMDEYVATLTTICTPHRGCRFVDVLCRLPERILRAVAKAYDNVFRKLGDRNPDFYGAFHQFTTKSSREFNEKVIDSPKVYYQSYASVMRDCFSDVLLTIPFCMIWVLERGNDGLVTPESAKWGEYRGVVRNLYHRGISHGDMIDLKRQDYKGFDIVEFYVKLVAELKEKGY